MSFEDCQSETYSVPRTARTNTSNRPRWSDEKAFEILENSNLNDLTLLIPGLMVRSKYEQTLNQFLVLLRREIGNQAPVGNQVTIDNQAPVNNLHVDEKVQEILKRLSWRRLSWRRSPLNLDWTPWRTKNVTDIDSIATSIHETCSLRFSEIPHADWAAYKRGYAMPSVRRVFDLHHDLGDHLKRFLYYNPQEFDKYQEVGQKLSERSPLAYWAINGVGEWYDLASSLISCATAIEPSRGLAEIPPIDSCAMFDRETRDSTVGRGRCASDTLGRKGNKVKVWIECEAIDRIPMFVFASLFGVRR